MRKRLFYSLAAGAALLLAPAGASATPYDANVCALPSSLNVCVGFDLTQVSNPNASTWNYTLQVTFNGAYATPQGKMTAAGIYDLNGNPNVLFSNLAWVGAAPTGWQLSCNGLNGGGVNSFDICTGTTNGINNALAPGQSLTISFTSNTELNQTLFTQDGGLGYRAHVQGVTNTSCSLKPDSRLGVVDGDDAVAARCGSPTPPSTTTPEPVSMLLLGSGLFGVGAVRRRRKGMEVADG